VRATADAGGGTVASLTSVAVGFAAPLGTALATDGLSSWVGWSATGVVVAAVGCYAAFQGARGYTGATQSRM
jgi:hypothetical protein